MAATDTKGSKKNTVIKDDARRHTLPIAFRDVTCDVQKNVQQYESDAPAASDC
jgi:hypothetical protein